MCAGLRVNPEHRIDESPNADAMDEPPAEISGRVTPTMGSRPDTMPMLMSTCQKNITATPIQTTEAKRSRAVRARFTAQMIRNRYSPSSTTEPMNPHSSAHTAKGKSVQVSGRNPSAMASKLMP